jgi:heptosyltransferase-2
MATPALRALHRRYPRATIAYVGRGVALQVLAGTDRADLAIEQVPRSSGRLRSLWATAQRIRKLRAEMTLLLPNSFHAALLARLGGCRGIIGYDRDGRGLLLDRRLRPARGPDGAFLPAPMIDYYNALAIEAGCDPPETRMELPLTDRAEQEARDLWDKAGMEGRTGPAVILNPGGAFGPSKMWPAERYAALADALIDRCQARIILNAAPNEKSIALRVEAAMTHRPTISFARRDNSLPLLRSLVRRCDLMVTNDTGARHFGVALGLDVVTLFGSTDPRWTDLYYDRERMIRVDLPCSPCQKKICPLPAGPRYHKCMEDIDVEQVLDACLELLATSPAKGGRSWAS